MRNTFEKFCYKILNAFIVLIATIEIFSTNYATSSIAFSQVNIPSSNKENALNNLGNNSVNFQNNNSNGSKQNSSNANSFKNLTNNSQKNNNNSLNNNLSNKPNSLNSNTVNNLNSNKTNQGFGNQIPSYPQNQSSQVPEGPSNTLMPTEPSTQAINGTGPIPGPNQQNSGPLPARPMVAQEPVYDPQKAALEEKSALQLKGILQADLSKFCLDYCTVLSMNGQAEEVFSPSNSELGFENETESGQGERKYSIRSAKAEVLVDARFGSLNATRLQTLMQKLLQKYPSPVTISWSTVSFPESALASKSELEIRTEFASQIRSQLEKAVQEYCPRDCKVNALDVKVIRSGVDEVQDGNLARHLFAQDSKGSLYVKGIKANISMNSLMNASRKNRIQALMKQMLSPFGTITLNVTEMEFPASAEEIQKDLDDKRNDPYGIEKLKNLLQLFKDYANTKEIIKENFSSQSDSSQSSINNESQSEIQSMSKQDSKEINSNSSANNHTLSNNEKSSSQNSTSSNSLKDSSKESSSNSDFFSEAFWTPEKLMYAGIGLTILVIVLSIGMRYVSTGRRVQSIVSESINQHRSQSANQNLQGNVGIDGNAQTGGDQVLAAGGGGGYTVLQRSPAFGIANPGAPSMDPRAGEKIANRMQIDVLKGEIFEYFFNNPVISRDVVGRILREDGVELSAKYVVILGDMLFFDILKDTELSQEVFTLAEFVHVSPPNVPEDEQLNLLRNLKVRLAAGKIRKIANKSLDIFDFLRNKTPRQVLDLIREETPKTQSIVFTQLPSEQRRHIFELLSPYERIEILKELSKNDNVAREYLFNVAEALKRKANGRSKFTGENVHGADVLLDLLERADLQQQRQLMDDLDQTNPEASRNVRGRLISIETLPFLKDGLLLEIFLSMESHSMVTFLAGTREHIRSLVLSKCPPDLARDWYSMMESLKSVDAETHRLVELQVITKIRGYANQGLVNLLYINEALYPPNYDASTIHLAADAFRGKKSFRIQKPLVS